MMTRVVIADDHLITLEGLRSLLAKQPNIEVVAAVGDGRSALQACIDLAPDIAILDVAMPGLNGIETARHIATDMPQIKVIALSMHADRRFVMEMLRAGAIGYLLKICAFEELLTAIQTVSNNEPYLSPKIANIVLNDYLHYLPQADSSVFSVLTPREREILQLIAEGRITKEIARLLNISIKTVDTHRQQIMGKLNMHNIAELIKYAIREGIVLIN
ncbi:MAG TPA: response regulator transcription factor [Armatimonadota bacterium]|nr:response regulator transcription factor [Armatimonadota bacterium]